MNCFIFGESPRTCVYDITEEDLPILIRRIDRNQPDPFGIFEDRRGYFVQCLAKGRRFITEWAENKYRPGKTDFNQWCAQDSKRLAALGGSYNGKKIAPDKDPNLVTYSVTLRIFQAFLRGDPRPAVPPWRNISHILS